VVGFTPAVARFPLLLGALLFFFFVVGLWSLMCHVSHRRPTGFVIPVSRSFSSFLSLRRQKAKTGTLWSPPNSK
jgi:hypothetical protein